MQAKNYTKPDNRRSQRKIISRKEVVKRVIQNNDGVYIQEYSDIISDYITTGPYDLQDAFLHCQSLKASWNSRQQKYDKGESCFLEI